ITEPAFPGQAGLPRPPLCRKILTASPFPQCPRAPGVDHNLLRSWLGLPPGPWPPDHSTLLGPPLAPSDPAPPEPLLPDRLWPPPSSPPPADIISTPGTTPPGVAPGWPAPLPPGPPRREGRLPAGTSASQRPPRGPRQTPPRRPPCRTPTPPLLGLNRWSSP